VFFSFLKSCGATFALAGHLFRDYVRLVRGVWKLSKLPRPVVTVFGGSKIEQKHRYAQQANELGKLLMENGISVITGGGPGIMKAANCGAFKDSNANENGPKSVGIGVRDLPQEDSNECSNEFIVTKYFFARKWLLTRYADAFAVFPGGFGTLDELFQIATLMQTGKLKRVPIVLIDKGHWQPLLTWLEKPAKEGLILEKDKDIFFVTDDIQEAFKHLYAESKQGHQ